MAQAFAQDLPERPPTAHGWSVRKLLSPLAPLVTVAKVFSVVDTIGALCLCLLTIFIGAGVLMDKEVSWPMFLLAPLFSIIHVFEKEAFLRMQVPLKPKENVGAKQ